MRKLVAESPFDTLKHSVADLSAIARDGEEDHFHIAIGIVVAQSKDFRPNFCLKPKFLFQLALKRGGQFLAILDLAAREFPLQTVRVSAAPLTD